MNTKDETQEIKRLIEIMANGATDDAGLQKRLLDYAMARDSDETKANPNLEAPYCTRCGEKIRTTWAVLKSREEGRNLCGLCRDDELNSR